MRTRTTILTVAGALVVGAAGFGLATVLDDDPDGEVRTVPVAGVTATSAGAASGGPGTVDPVAAQSVAGLEQLAGRLTSGDDLDDWYVAGVELDFGPDGWLVSAPAIGDLDGDGAAEPLLDELRGLDRADVTLGVRYEDDDDRDRDDATVYTIQGVTYREPSGPAPWQIGVDQPAADRATVEAAAAAAVGAGARVLELEPEDDAGPGGWDAEVLGPDGREYQVLVDAAGTVLDVRLEP